MKICINLHTGFYLVSRGSSYRIKHLVMLIALMMSLSIKSYSMNFYVKSTGNDNNTGLSDAQAWSTIAKVNASFFAPGDTIFFKKGDTWRETLTVSSSGTTGKSIVITSYGTGDNPIITGSDLVMSWSKHDINIWKATITKQPNIVYFNNEKRNTKATHECAHPYEWYWVSNVLYLYAPGDTDPSASV